MATAFPLPPTLPPPCLPPSSPPPSGLAMPGQGQVVCDGGVVWDMGWSVGEGSTLEPKAHVDEVGVLSKVTTLLQPYLYLI
jgi:hypothetical protein